MNALSGPTEWILCYIKSILFVYTDCEHLVRRMLVRDPKKRHTIAQIKQHKWMQVQCGQPKEPVSSPIELHNSEAGEPNEQILRLMQSLGIDQSKTVQVGTRSFI